MMQFVRKHWKLLLIATVVLAMGRAMAQDEFVFDPVGWGENPALALTALIGAVAMIRQTKWGSSIDGPVRVAILTAVIGMLGGVALQMFGMLTHPTVAVYPSPWGGLLYGLGLAFTAMTGVAVFNYGAKKLSGGEQTLDIHTGQATSQILDFILAQLRALVGPAKLPAAITAVAPIIAEFAQSKAVLTDDLRANLQARLLSAVRAAGLMGQDL